MSNATFELTAQPEDEAPTTDDPVAESLLDYETYPDATPDAPYGFTKSGRRRNRPIGAKRGGSAMPASENSAAMAAALLARLNGLVGISLAMLGMPLTAEALTEANMNFELMAKEALRADPKLCRKILSAGAESGKAGLVMSYVILGGSIVPAAVMEIRDKRETVEGEVTDESD